ncbi:DNA-binding transcription repressor [Hanseniaspora uvarum]|nr:DNA-binding transcription repressor [Hanseniaspora uvarum]
MTSDNNDHLHDHNNHYSNDNMHDEFLNGNDNHNEELMNKTGDINDIDQYIQNIPVSADQSDKHIIGNVIRPSMNIFGNLHQTPVQTLNTTGTTTNSNNMSAYYSQILSNYNGNGHENGFNVPNNVNTHSYDAYNNNDHDNIQGNNILGVFDNTNHLEKEHTENDLLKHRETGRKSNADSYNHLTGIPQLDAHVIANMSWFQNPPSHLYKNLDVQQLPTSREKEEAEAIIANMNLDLSTEQALGVQQRRIIDDDVLKKQIKTKKTTTTKKTKARKAMIHDLSLLTKQSINEISPLLSDMNNYNKYLQTSQFKNDTKTQRRVQKRKSLLKQGPKRPSSAYFFYCQEERKNLQKQFPTLMVPELQKKLGEQWRSLTDAEKEPYKEAHRLAWEKYKVEKDEYVKTLPPKKPSGPFVDFINSQKDRLTEKNHGKKLQMQELTRLCVEEWKNLDENTKLRYNLRHKEKIDEWIKAYNDIDVKEMKELMKMKQDMLEAKNLAIEKNRIYQEELAADLERQERIKKLEQGALDDFNRMENMGP